MHNNNNSEYAIQILCKIDCKIFLYASKICIKVKQICFFLVFCITLENCTCVNFRWPALKIICNKHWCNGGRNVKEEVIERVRCRQKLLDYLSKLYHQNYYKSDLSFSDMLNFKEIFYMEDGDKYPLKYHYLVDEVNEILQDNDW